MIDLQKSTLLRVALAIASVVTIMQTLFNASERREHKIESSAPSISSKFVPYKSFGRETCMWRVGALAPSRPVCL